MGALFLVQTRCTDPAREEEFNRWYDTVHVPDVLAAEGVVAAQRFKLAGRPPENAPNVQYLAIYELEGDDPRPALRNIQAEVQKATAAGRMIDCLEIVSATTFVPLGPRQEARR